MKSASEMYKFAYQNSYIKPEGIVTIKEKVGTNLFHIVENQLLFDESVLLCFLGVRLDHNKLSGATIWAFAFTNTRLIQGTKRIFGGTLQETLDLSNISGVSKKSGITGMSNYIEVSTPLFNANFSIKVGKYIDDLFNKINDLLSKYKSNTQPITTNASSTADEILKFKQLLDQDIITQDEFDKKKSQLLS
jgi:hypothetical protein